MATTTLERTKTPETTPDESQHWRARRTLSLVVRLVAIVLPIVASVAATRLAAAIVPKPRAAIASIAWWAAMLLVATVVVFAVGRATRRLTPLAALLKLSLAFPDHAPSRYSVALRSGTVHQLQKRYEKVKSDGLGSTPAEAARRLVEMVGALDAHDRITRGHCERVRAYTVMIAEELKLPKHDIDRLRWSGLLHDLGKLEVPAEILNKKGRLTDDEWEIIKRHPAAGARIAAPLAGWLGDMFPAIGEHHERWDGDGYPAGLSGEGISLGARIVAVADAFDVMTAARSYKPPNSPAWARAELVACAGSQFDPVVVRAFLNVSLGRLRWTMGPLSWLAQLPMLVNAPIAAVSGTVATTAFAATVAVSAVTMGGVLPDATDASAAVSAAVTPGPSNVLFFTDSPTSTTLVVGGPSTSAARVPGTATTPTSASGTTIPGAPSTTVVTAPTSEPVVTTPTASTTAPSATTVPGSPSTTPTSTQATTPATTPTTTPTTSPTTPTTPPPTTPTTIGSGNGSPIAINDAATIPPGSQASRFIRTLDNDSDPDGDDFEIESVTQPPASHGSVEMVGDGVMYTPGATPQNATFTYTIVDDYGNRATATVTITVG